MYASKGHVYGGAGGYDDCLLQKGYGRNGVYGETFQKTAPLCKYYFPIRKKNVFRRQKVSYQPFIWLQTKSRYGRIKGIKMLVFFCVKKNVEDGRRTKNSAAFSERVILEPPENDALIIAPKAKFAIKKK